MIDPSKLLPSQRRDLANALTSPGGQLLVALLEERLGSIEREAGAVILEPGDPERLLSAVQPFIEEAGHVRYLRDALGVLAAKCVDGYFPAPAPGPAAPR